MTSNFDSIAQLLPRYFSGESTAEEQEIVDAWRSESPENEEEFRQLRKSWDSFPLLLKMEQYNSFEALPKVNERIRLQESRNWQSRFQRIAAILILPLLAYTGYLLFKNNSVKDVSTAGPVWQTICTPPGVKSHFYLPDSTAVWLNSSSSITYPVAFSDETRRVKIKGEAFLDVRKDPALPFLVDLGKIKVKVLGTRFDVLNFENEPQTDVILVSGGISLHRGNGRDDKVLTTMDPGEMAVFDKETNSLDVKPVQTEKYIAWTEGKLIFRNDPMDEVVRRLNHWFNVQIEIADPGILEYIYTATFMNESIDQILELLTISAPIRYQVVQREKKGDVFLAKQIILRKIK